MVRRYGEALWILRYSLLFLEETKNDGGGGGGGGG